MCTDKCVPKKITLVCLLLGERGLITRAFACVNRTLLESGDHAALYTGGPPDSRVVLSRPFLDQIFTCPSSPAVKGVFEVITY